MIYTSFNRTYNPFTLQWSILHSIWHRTLSLSPFNDLCFIQYDIEPFHFHPSMIYTSFNRTYNPFTFTLQWSILHSIGHRTLSLSPFNDLYFIQ